jgi:prepilin-type processing-associated H-X9-DG protein
MKQLGLGFNLFNGDHDEKFPPANYGANDKFHLSWDDYLNQYIGSTDSDSDLIKGITASGKVPPVLRCPADRILPSATVSWAADDSQRRSYAMNWAGPGFTLDSVSKPLPPATYGVGIYYAIGGLPSWESPGYKTDVIKDPSGTILLVELPNARNVAGNDWPSFCAGPGPTTAYSSAGITPDCIQTGDATATMNYGSVNYGLHSKRFNYLFHDGHVEPLKIGETIGSGTTNAPKGMWTMTPGD